MKLTWMQLADKYIPRHEVTRKIVPKSAIQNLTKINEDYLIYVKCTHGEIYKYSEDGSTWVAYVKPSKFGLKRRATLRKLNDLGGEKVQVGDFESAWKFGANQLDLVAILMKAEKRKKRKTS